MNNQPTAGENYWVLHYSWGIFLMRYKKLHFFLHKNMYSVCFKETSRLILSHRNGF